MRAVNINTKNARPAPPPAAKSWKGVTSQPVRIVACNSLRRPRAHLSGAAGGAQGLLGNLCRTWGEMIFVTCCATPCEKYWAAAAAGNKRKARNTSWRTRTSFQKLKKQKIQKQSRKIVNVSFNTNLNLNLNILLHKLKSTQVISSNLSETFTESFLGYVALCCYNHNRYFNCVLFIISLEMFRTQTKTSKYAPWKYL